MSRSSLGTALVLVVVVCSGAAPVPAICPSAIVDVAGKHILGNASLYDGPPAEMADLVPDPAGVVDRWNLDGVDPYLVCKFSGTAKVVTFHAVGAKVCEAGHKPFQAYCRR